MADAADAQMVFCFGNFVVDAEQGCLRDLSGTEIPLRPKSFDVLQVFVQSAGRMLTKRVILDAVWPDVHVTEDSIVQCVRDIRRALRDDAGSLLRTVARRGYIFDVKVRKEARQGVMDRDPGLNSLGPTGGGLRVPSIPSICCRRSANFGRCFNQSRT